MPLRGTACGLLGALSTTDRDALRPPSAVGLKVIEMMQEFPGAMFAPFVQVVPLATAKSAALTPEIVGAEVKFNAALPEFVTITDIAALVLPIG